MGRTIKRFVLVLAWLCLATHSYVHAAVPTLVHGTNCPSSTGSALNAGTYNCPLSDSAIGGNAIVVQIAFDDGTTPTVTVTDDKSDTFTLACGAVGDGNNQNQIYVGPNVTAGAKVVKITFSTTTNPVDVLVAEFNNIATSSPVDSCSNNSTTSGTIDSGNLTFSVSGDLIFHGAMSAQAYPANLTSITVGSHANITWHLTGQDLNDGSAWQYGVYNATTTFDPTFTATSYDFLSSAVALKSASAGGTDTNTVRIIYTQHQQMQSTQTSPYAIQTGCPSGANFIVISTNGGQRGISSITSTPSNTWTVTTNSVGGQNNSQFAYVMPSASIADTMTLSVVLAAAPPGDRTFIIHCLVVPSNLAFDQTVSVNGTTNSQPATLTVCSSCLTPAQANELIFGNLNQNNCTAEGYTSPTFGNFDAAFYTGVSLDGPEPVDQNGFWFHGVDSNANAITVTISYSCGGNNLADWAGQFIAFKVPATNGIPVGSLLLMGVGR